MLACCLALSIVCNAECRRAQEDEVPHGANQLIELKEQTIKRVFGTISTGFTNSPPTPNVVVEVYRSTGNQDFQKTLTHYVIDAANVSSRTDLQHDRTGRQVFFPGIQAGPVFAACRNETTGRD
jgi:hypothetical protein